MKISTRFSFLLLYKFKRFFLIAFTFILGTLSSFGQSQPIFPNNQALLTGVANQPGAVYLVQDVELAANGTATNVDALLSIVSFTGAPVIGNVDNTQFVQNRFEPTITYDPAGEAVRWRMEFIVAGTADANIADAVAYPLDQYTLEIIDLDAQEWAEVFVPSSYELAGANQPETIITAAAGALPNTIRFTSANITDAGVSTANTRSIVKINYNNVSVVDFTLGRDSNAPNTTRNISVGFLGEVTFGNPFIVTVNNPPVVVDQNASTDFDTPSNPINLLSGSSDPENNINNASVFLVDPNNPNNFGEVGRPLTIPGEGTYVLDNNGNVVFTPQNGFTGTSSVNFRVNDLTFATSNTSTLTIILADPCDAAASGNTDTDGDNVSDTCDLDDDNDGILDLNEQGVVNCNNLSTPLFGAAQGPNNYLGSDVANPEVGDSFLYNDVYSGVDAIVTIVFSNDVEISTLDATNTGVNSFFQPQIDHANATSYTEFKIDFVVANSTTPALLADYIY